MILCLFLYLGGFVLAVLENLAGAGARFLIRNRPLFSTPFELGTYVQPEDPGALAHEPSNCACAIAIPSHGHMEHARQNIRKATRLNDTPNTQQPSMYLFHRVVGRGWAQCSKVSCTQHTGFGMLPKADSGQYSPALNHEKDWRYTYVQIDMKAIRETPQISLCIARDMTGETYLRGTLEHSSD